MANETILDAALQLANIRNLEYLSVVQVLLESPRWELYKLLSEPLRLRLLALAAKEELAIGELAELTGENQPNVSRHLKPLRRLGLLVERKEGTRVYVRLDTRRIEDPVVADAADTGLRLCRDDGSLARIDGILRAREAPSRDYFATPKEAPSRWPGELGAYLAALAPLIRRRKLAVDVGTGDGSFIEVLAPVFDQVFAFDRSPARVELAQTRVNDRGYHHVRVALGELGDEVTLREARQLSRSGADAVFAARVLHHASKPSVAMAALAELAAPGGVVVVVDYARHEDETMRLEHADTWLGFDGEELKELAIGVGMEDAAVTRISAHRCGDGPDGHLDWQVLSATKRASA